MANLSETATWDTGVYQLETTDPVLGGPTGISNTPLRNLANRTLWLKELAETTAAQKAPLTSPAFTGTPTAPTAAPGTSSTQLATTAFTQNAVAAAVGGLVTSVAGRSGNVTLAVGDVAGSAPLTSPAFSGTPTAPTAAPGTSSTQIATTEFVAQAQVISMPPGMVAAFARPTAPNGWLKANGAAVSRSTYPNLFAAIGTTFGAGDGVNTFNLPDLRGEFVRGLDDGRGIDAARTIGSAQNSQNLAHNHGVTDPGHNHSSSIPTKPNGTGAGPVAMVDGINPISEHVSIATTSASANVSIQSSGGTEARPRNIALLYAIKF